MNANDPLEFFKHRLEQSYEPSEVDRILHGLAGTRATTLRANPLRSSAEAVASALTEAGIPYQPVTWYDDGFILPEASEAALQDLEGYDQGHFYVQNLSAMVPPLALGDCAGKDVLDMCAAPGGKTTEIAALSGGKAMITACERSKPRAERLEFNLGRQGAQNVMVMRTDSRNLDPFFSFDAVLLDAPCSGSGTLRLEKPKSLANFTELLVEKSVRSQRALIAKAMTLVRPGGTLVYATCSVLPEENEAIVEFALGHQPKGANFAIKPVTIPGFPQAALLPTPLEGTFTICPDEIFEGFFVAVLKRTA